MQELQICTACGAIEPLHSNECRCPGEEQGDGSYVFPAVATVPVVISRVGRGQTPQKAFLNVVWED